MLICRTRRASRTMWIKVAFVLCILVSIANGSNEQNVGVSVEELFNLILKHDVTLVDVRMPWELKKEGKIATSINIPLQKLKDALSLPPEEFEIRFHRKMPAKDDCNLIFHCRSGKRSLKATKLAREMGWTCARHLIGGFNAWKSYFYWKIRNRMSNALDHYSL